VPSHRDLLQAHRLMTQRSALALISGEPDSPNQPLRRLNVGTISSLLAGAIAAAVFAVLGLISPGSATGSATGLSQAGTLVVDSASATAYVPCDSGKLCPALNYTSALLALDSASVRRVEVSPAALAHYSLGPTIGVAGLPQDLPVAQNLVTGPWAVCATTAGTTLVGGHTVGGTPLGPGSAALATTGNGDVWVLWDGQRLAVQPSVAQTLFPAMQVQTVPSAWLNAVPEGAPFAAPHIPGQGTQVTGPDGLALVGQVFDQPGSGGAAPQYYALLADGKLAHITATQAQLLTREPGAQAARQISPSAATADLSTTLIPQAGLPATIPAVTQARSALCVTYGRALGRQIVTSATVPLGATPTNAATSSTALTRVWLPPAHGALIGAAPANTHTGVTAYFLVTGATRYALPTQSVASILGYTLKSDSTVLPAGVLDQIPAGPPLSPTAATKPSGTG
jgi:type VII secretion protein EccB